MSQLLTYNNTNDGASSRRYSGFPLNSTLVSSYTPDTIRSIISHAAAGQPYSTAVWIRISRVGIQVSAQDSQIARTRIPVFIPIGLVHDIYMLPNINNVVCIVYDELQSNMKGVLLYVVHPSDAQLLRDDFRIVKQASNVQQLPPAPYSSPFDNRFSQTSEFHPPGASNRLRTTTSANRSPLTNDQYRNTVTIRQPSPKRIVYVRDTDTTATPNETPAVPELSYVPSKSTQLNGREDSRRRQNKSPKRNVSGNSPTKRSSDNTVRRSRKHRSRSSEQQGKTKLPVSNSSQELSQEQIRQQQEQLLLQQQQQWLLHQQQMAAWQAAQQQGPVLPIGIYNRYVPKTIPLPTGETIKTAVPPQGTNGTPTNGVAIAYIEPQQKPTTEAKASDIVPPRSSTNQNTTTNTQSTRLQQQRRQATNETNDTTLKSDPNKNAPTTQTSRSRTKFSSSKEYPKNLETDDDTKQYLKMLIDEMQAMKIEMNKMRQSGLGITKGRSDSLQGDLKEIRSHIDHIRTRMALTPKIAEHTKN